MTTYLITIYSSCLAAEMAFEGVQPSKVRPAPRMSDASDSEGIGYFEIDEITCTNGVEDTSRYI